MNARDYLTVLRESGWVIAVCVVIGLVLGGVSALVLPKTYESSVTFFVVADGPTSGESATTYSDTYQGAQLAKDRVKTYQEILTGPRVAADAAAALGVSPSDVEGRIATSSVADTVLFTMTASAGSPESAQELAQAATNSFRSLVDELERPSSVGERDPRAPLLQADVVQEPTLPETAASPVMALNIAIGLIVGLILGFGIAIARRSMDSSVRTPEALEEITDAAVLGVVPEAPDGDPRTAATALVLPPNPAKDAVARAEAYRRIRTNIEFANVDGDVRVLVVTSALPEDGKTVTACNIAGSLAAVGARVLLVDADLRKPRVGEYLGLEMAVGLTTVLTGRAELDDAVQRSVGYDVLASGATAARPNELLASRAAGELIGRLRERYDYVIIDAPPVLPVADAANIAAHADGIVLVTRWRITRERDLAAATRFLRSASLPIVGAVLGRVPRSAGLPWTTYGGAYAASENVPEAPESPESPDPGAVGPDAESTPTSIMVMPGAPAPTAPVQAPFPLGSAPVPTGIVPGPRDLGYPLPIEHVRRSPVGAQLFQDVEATRPMKARPRPATLAAEAQADTEFAAAVLGEHGTAEPPRSAEQEPAMSEPESTEAASEAPADDAAEHPDPTVDEAEDATEPVEDPDRGAAPDAAADHPPTLPPNGHGGRMPSPFRKAGRGRAGEPARRQPVPAPGSRTGGSDA